MPVGSWAVLAVLAVGVQEELCSGEQQAEVCSHIVSWDVYVRWFGFPALLLADLH